jgi:DNA gyrase subunit B
VDNSVDEALAGHCDEINVFITKKGWIKVVDNGRGIPVDMQFKARRELLLLTKTITSSRT